MFLRHYIRCHLIEKGHPTSNRGVRLVTELWAFSQQWAGHDSEQMGEILGKAHITGQQWIWNLALNPYEISDKKPRLQQTSTRIRNNKWNNRLSSAHLSSGLEGALTWPSTCLSFVLVFNLGFQCWTSKTTTENFLLPVYGMAGPWCAIRSWFTFADVARCG